MFYTRRMGFKGRSTGTLLLFPGSVAARRLKNRVNLAPFGCQVDAMQAEAVPSLSLQVFLLDFFPYFSRLTYDQT